MTDPRPLWPVLVELAALLLGMAALIALAVGLVTNPGRVLLPALEGATVVLCVVVITRRGNRDLERALGDDETPRHT
jgi:hypothetical protein